MRRYQNIKTVVAISMIADSTKKFKTDYSASKLSEVIAKNKVAKNLLRK